MQTKPLPPLPTLRVLLIEDEEEDYILTHELLRHFTRWQCEVTWAASYAEGLAAVQTPAYDVYLVDYRLGADSGFDLVRAIAPVVKAPVILLTGQASTETDTEALRAGAADHIEKGAITVRLLERTLHYAQERYRYIQELRALNISLEHRVNERTLELSQANTELQKSYEVQQRLLRQQTLLNDVLRTVSSNREVDPAAQTAVEVILRLTGWPAALIGALNATGTEVSLLAVKGNAIANFQTGQTFPVYQGIIGRVLRSGQPQYVPDMALDPDYIAYNNDIRSLLILPLLRRQRVNGLLGIASPVPHGFSPEDQALANLLADAVALNLDNAYLFTALRESRDLFETLVALARTATEELTLHNILNVAAYHTHAERGHLLIFFEDSTMMRSNFVEGQAQPVQPASLHSPTLTQGLSGWVIRNQTSALVPDVTKDDRWMVLADQGYVISSALVIPIIDGPLLRGVLALFHSQNKHFTTEHLRLLEAASPQLGLALRNAQLYESQQRAVARRTALYETLRTVSETLEFTQAAQIATETIARQTGWQHLGLNVVDEAGKKLTLLAGTGALRPLLQLQLSIQEGIIGRAFRTRKTQYVPDVQQDPDYVSSTDALATALAVPLRRGERVFGVLNIEREANELFLPEDIFLAESLADAIALALDNARLHAVAKDNESALRNARNKLEYLLRRFVPSPVARQVIAQKELPQLGGQRRWVTVMFADIRGYTALANSLDPEPLLDLLNQHFALIGQAVISHGGMINQYAGDMLMASFNALEDQPHHAIHAVVAALEAQTQLRMQTPIGLDKVEFGIGIYTGQVVCGYLGFEDRFDYATLGKTTNIAFRLCSLARPGQILVGAETQLELGLNFDIREVGQLPMKGDGELVQAYEVIGYANAVPALIA